MDPTGDPLHDADVRIVELNRSTVSADDGSYQFENVPPGIYQVVVHLDSLFTDGAELVSVAEGSAARADFSIGLRAQRIQLTVTASAREETTFESFNAVKSLDAYDLALNTGVSLGETLSNQVGTGIAKRSFGPGASRPIIRGFDGDRVLIMQDGVRTGTLSSQSGDHGEVLNTAQLERLEIVKGPATLLYSGNAMGGTVNAISRHHNLHFHPHTGMRGFMTGSGGTANAMGGASAGFEYGQGNWMIWGQGGGIRTGDYQTPAGQIFNSRARQSNGGIGLGWFGQRTFVSFDFELTGGSSGIPFAQELHGGHEEEEPHEDGDEDEDPEHEHEEELERVTIDVRRANYRMSWGWDGLGPALSTFLLKLNYTQWDQDEIEFLLDGDQFPATQFSQDQFVYRGEFEQRQRGPLTGLFGFWGMHRAYDVAGEEALSPPVDHNAFAVFGLEELGFERVKYQFGGRLETNRYSPAFPERGPEGLGVLDAIDRTYTGGSASAGVHVGTWNGGAFVANYAHSYRAPALEELYNYGPHAGNLAFEVGNPALKGEVGNGFDLSLRHETGRVQGEVNFFYYRFSNFIFPFATGAADDSGLRIVDYTQRNARYVGGEASLSLSLNDYFRATLGLDAVNAMEIDFNTPLPRIPPLRGKLGFEYNYRGVRLLPELIVAHAQNDTFTGETRTPGYAVVNLTAAYTYALQHVAHQFSFNVFNVGDRLYRNHSSFIKELAPEIGRGVKFTYTVRFF